MSPYEVIRKVNVETKKTGTVYNRVDTILTY